MEKSSRTTTSYLFDLCLRVIIKMAKTKAKRVPYRDFNPRDRYSIETWRKVKSLFNQGFKRAQIEDQMKIKLHKRTFNQNMKKNYDVPDVNSRKLNRSNKRTDCTVMNDFERDLVRLFNTKNRHGAFGYFFLSLSDGEKPRNKQLSIESFFRKK